MGGRVRSVALSKVAGTVMGVLTAGALLAGCSSDVARFDYPSFGLTSNNPKRTTRPTPTEYVPIAPAARLQQRRAH
jgi:hypothetical protein